MWFRCDRCSDNEVGELEPVHIQSYLEGLTKTQVNEYVDISAFSSKCLIRNSTRLDRQKSGPK